MNKKSQKTFIHRGVMPIPPRATLRTRYWATGILNNAASTFCNNRYQPTFGYDVDPLSGSTSMPFFSEMAGFYRQYRLSHSKIKVHFTNMETFPVHVCLCPVNFDPTLNTSSFLTYYSNPLSKTESISPLGGVDRASLKLQASTDSFGGSKWTGTADSYSALTAGTSPPTNNWYFFVGVVCPPSAFSAGVHFSLEMDCTYIFFEENSPAT